METLGLDLARTTVGSLFWQRDGRKHALKRCNAFCIGEMIPNAPVATAPVRITQGVLAGHRMEDLSTLPLFTYSPSISGHVAPE